MSNQFTEEDWKLTNSTWGKFWGGDLKRPVIFMERIDPQLPKDLDYKMYFQQYGLEKPIEEIVAIEDRHLKTIQYLGDGFPRRFVNFGPGSMASYLGSKSTCDDTTIWFHELDKELEDIDIKIDYQNEWYLRVTEVQTELLKKWGRDVVVTYSDIGGNMDLLASLRGTENLVLDTYDYTELIVEKVKQITENWLLIFKEESQRLKASTRGFMPWAPVYSSDKTTYMMQSDFAYMISPAMYEKFVMPDLRFCCEHIDIPFYHLDGKGQLAHLDLLLSIEKLQGIQWIPGAGEASASEWPEVLQKIRDGGKYVQIYSTVEEALSIKSKMSLEGFIIEIIDGNNYSTEELNGVYSKLTA